MEKSWREEAEDVLGGRAIVRGMEMGNHEVFFFCLVGFFNWRITALQCYVGFWRTTM